MISLLIVGFIVCVATGALSLTALSTAHWMLWEVVVTSTDLGNAAYGKRILTETYFGLFRFCTTAHVDGASGTGCFTLSDQSFNSHIKIVHAFTILGLIGTGIGGILLIVFSVRRKNNGPSQKSLVYLAATFIGLSALGSLIGGVVFATVIYKDLEHLVDSGQMSSTLNLLSFNTDNEDTSLSWSFYVCIASVVCGFLSAILVAVGAKRLTEPVPAQAGLRAPGVFYNPNQTVVTMQAPPAAGVTMQAPWAGYGYGLTPYYIPSQDHQVPPHNYYMGAQMATDPPAYEEKGQFPPGEQPGPHSNYIMASGGQATPASPPAYQKKDQTSAGVPS